MQERVQLGRIYADRLTFSGALDAIAALVLSGRGGYVVTPNVDHLCLAEHSRALRHAYRGARLSLVDGMPLVWLARALGQPLPAKISGSDLTPRLMHRAAHAGWRVYFLGANEGVGKRAACVLKNAYPDLQIVGVDAPRLGFERHRRDNDAVIERLQDARPNIVLVALGCPKQELWMADHAHKVPSAIFLGIGATLDFISGRLKRCPAWMSASGLEWLYRLSQQPRRLARRYLVRDRAFLAIAWRTWRNASVTRATA